MIKYPEEGGCAGRAGAHLPMKAVALSNRVPWSHIFYLQSWSTAPLGTILPLDPKRHVLTLNLNPAQVADSTDGDHHRHGAGRQRVPAVRPAAAAGGSYVQIM